MNNVVIIGRLTRDPELRHTQTGTAVATMTIAVDRPVAKETTADFIDIVMWNKTAENAANYLGKGRLVAVKGRIQVRSYTDSKGIKRKATEVVAENVKYLDKALSKEEQDVNAFPPPEYEDKLNDFDESGVPF